MINISLNYPADATIYPVPSSNQDNDYASLVVVFEQALAAAVNALAPYIPGTWTDLVLANDWVAGSAAPQYRVDNAGNVFLRGICSNGVDKTQVMTTIPVSPPLHDTPFLMPLGTPGVGTLSISTAGVITPTFYPAGADASSSIGLNDISYSTIA